MARYVQRNEDGKIVSDYSMKQHDFPTELMEEDDPEYLAYLDWQENPIPQEKINSEGPTEL